jgi:foldase protein PrsA
MKLHTLFIAAFLVAGSGAYPQVDNSRIVAVINGEELKGAEFYRRMEFLPEIGRVFNNDFVESTPAFWTLERIITEKLILAVAKQMAVFPSPTELATEVAARTADVSALEAWTASGQTKAELEHQILIQFCQFKIATAGVNVTDLEVEKFFKDYPSMFTIPRRHKLRVISVSDDAKKAQIDIQLQSGKSFIEVAKTMSEDITKTDGGFFGIVDITRVNDLMRKAIEATKIGGVTPWLDTGTQKLKFFVEEIVPAQVQKLDEKLKKTIRRRMMLDRGKVKNDVPKLMAQARSGLKIDIKAKELAAEYDRVLRQLPPVPSSIKP